MKVESNKDDVLSKGYPVSKMLIVLSTVFICQDSQRACIHFVCSKQTGPLSVCVCVQQWQLRVDMWLFLCMLCVGVCMCFCVRKNANLRPLHVFVGTH